MVATRENSKPPPTEAPRRSSRERTTTSLATASPGAVGKTHKPIVAKKKNKAIKTSLRLVASRRLDQQRKKTAPPKVLQDPFTNETVWVATATVADLKRAERFRRPPWLLSRRYLVSVPSLLHRQAVYDRAAAALAELETRVLPHYGQRPWQCVVTFKEQQPLQQQQQKASGKKPLALPYFIWDKRGRLELAAFPHLVDKMPRPPRFPGYTTSTNAANNSRSKRKSATARFTAASAAEQNQPENCTNSPNETIQPVTSTSEPILETPSDTSPVDEVMTTLSQGRVYDETLLTHNDNEMATVVTTYATPHVDNVQESAPSVLDSTPEPNPNVVNAGGVCGAAVLDDIRHGEEVEQVEVEEESAPSALDSTPEPNDCNSGGACDAAVLDDIGHGDEVEQVEVEEEEEEDEEEDDLSEDPLGLRDLQERPVSGLSTLAWDLRWRVSVPTIQYKWISPLRRTFSSRKAAWAHAVELCQHEVLLDKVLTGYGAHGKQLKLAPQPRSAVVKAGKLRFDRDGLWIVGQEETWGRERLPVECNDVPVVASSEASYINSIKSVTNTTLLSSTESSLEQGQNHIKPPRRLTGISYFIQCNQKSLRQKRLQELTQSFLAVAFVTPNAATNVPSFVNDESSLVSPLCHTVAESPFPTTPIVLSPIQKKTHKVVFSMRDAVKELRSQWKSMSESEHQTWRDDAAKEQNRLDQVITATRDMESKGTPNDSVVTDLVVADSFVISRHGGPDDSRCFEEKRSVVSTSPTPSVENDERNLSAIESSRHDSSTPNFSVVSALTNHILSAEAGKKRASGSTKKTGDFHRSKMWCMTSDQMQKCHDSGMEHYDQIMRTVTARDLTQELQDGFDLLRERGKGRWDMNLPEWDSPDYDFLNSTKKSPWMPIVNAILGKDAVLIHKGMFLSMPGSSRQVYHQDGPHLTTQYQKACHAINVFIPLVDLTLENGPTEFCLGSHILGHDELDESFLFTPTVTAGTPIIFDYRLGHRGLANTSTLCRPIVYCTYAAAADGKEFRDSENFSRKRYHRIGELVEKGLSRKERAEKRVRHVEKQNAIVLSET